MRTLFAGLVSCLLFTGCWSSSPNEVVVYTALDREFSEPVLEEFSKEMKINVLPKFDVESTKTVGLTQAIMAEANHPRCDVFWNNEIINTLRLKEKGLLEVYSSPAAKDYPELFRAADGTWHGFAARARIFIVSTKLVPESERPKGLGDLLDPKWKGKIGIAKPLFGTTATHAACLFAAWGDEKAKDFFRRLKANDVQILSGNKQVALAAASGQIAFGLTDTDDAIVEIENGHPVAVVYPDRADDGLGTLFIPNTVSVIKGCPHPEAARKLVDYLLSPVVEKKLAVGPSAQIPLSYRVKTKPRVETPQTVHAMEVDFAVAVAKWDAAVEFMRDEFTAP